MSRAKGDKNLSLREQRLIARIEGLKAEIRAQKEKSLAKLKVRDARIRELKSKVRDGK
jgi:hypothetical protein